MKIYFGGAASTARARPSLLLCLAQTQRTAGVCSRQSEGTWRMGVCILVAVKHKMARARLRRLVLMQGLQSRSPELPQLYLTHEASSIWTNKLTDTGWTVTSDVHGVGPLGISQAFASSNHIPRAIAQCCNTVKCHPCPHVKGTHVPWQPNGIAVIFCLLLKCAPCLS